MRSAFGPGFASPRALVALVALAFVALVASPLAARSEPPVVRPLELRLAPPRDPTGRPWTIEVRDAEGLAPGALLASAESRLDGSWLHAAVPAGRPFRVRARTSAGEVWWVSPSRIVLAEETGPIELDLGMLRVHGVALLGRRPLHAGLLFRDEEGEVAVRLRSNADGLFEGALPRPGRYAVRVTCDRPALDRLADVEVPDPRAPGVPPEPFVEARFRDPALQVEVVDEKGEPIARGILNEHLRGGGNAVRHDIVDGEVRIEGLPPGKTGLIASAPRCLSLLYSADVPPDDDPEFVRMVCERQMGIVGRVTTSAGSPVPALLVPGSRVRPIRRRDWRGLTYLRAPREPRRPASAGWFTALVPASMEIGCLLVPPRELPGFLGPFTIDANRETAVTIPATGGWLVLDVPERESGLFAILYRDGCGTRADELLRGDRIPIRGGMRIEAGVWTTGTYGLCTLTRKELDSPQGKDPPPAACVTGELPAGGSLVLVAPEREDAGDPSSTIRGGRPRLSSDGAE